MSAMPTADSQATADRDDAMRPTIPDPAPRRADRPRPPAPSGPRGGGHIPGLDGLRGLAILMVLVYHQTAMGPATALDRGFVRAVHNFGTGVDLFFVLSGFLITGILLDARGTSHYFRNFFARRALRIFPLYYAVLTVALVVLPRLPHPRQAKWALASGANQLWYWCYLSNWHIGRVGFRHGILDVSWSLAIEEQFYILWPLAVGFLSRRALARVCLTLIGLAFACRYGLIAGAGFPPLGAVPMGVHTFTTSRMDTLAFGALIAVVARGPGGLAPWRPAARRLAVAAAALLVAATLSPSGLAGPVGALGQSAIYSAFVALYGAVLVLVVTATPGSRTARALAGRLLVVFGTYSYALYLFHYPILGLVRDLAFRPERFPTLMGSPLPGQLAFYVAATLPALAAAWLSWRLLEGPVLSLKRHFPTGPRRPEGPATVDEPAPA